MNGSTWRWLMASLALNAVLLGALLGGGWMLARSPAPAPIARLREAGNALSAGQQPRFRAMLRDTRIANRPLLDRAQQARTQAATALVARPFDREALGGALGRARIADLALRQAREAAIVRFAATLSPDDRAALAAGLRTTMLRDGRGEARAMQGAGS
ncbi:periplasmic heavy metal sensor [Sphingomonas sp. Leaf4]|uniref:periplasmic heavy metal sensor n=1 Tax=Sphingomonas sp. Leaf4 TaxID=2876553 RepID=UPI001E30FBC6|nr:periplasmic heavy metal sensor [Sphingomonas sp. Leaf4]